MHNLDKDDPEGGAGSQGGTYSLQDQGEAPYHTCFKPFCIPDPILQVPAGNKPAIEYLYGTMLGINDNIRARRPSLVEWEVIHMIVTSMKHIVGSIFLNQCFVKEWLLSKAIVYLFWIYNYCSGYDADDVTKHIDTMMEERGKSPDVENLCSNLLEVHSKMRYWVKENLTNVLAPLLQNPAPIKYHYWFAIFLDPRYVMELADIDSFHQSKHIDTKVLVQQMIPKFYEYIMAAELYVHPNTSLILLRNNGDYLYFHNIPNRM